MANSAASTTLFRCAGSKGEGTLGRHGCGSSAFRVRRSWRRSPRWCLQSRCRRAHARRRLAVRRAQDRAEARRSVLGARRLAPAQLEGAETAPRLRRAGPQPGGDECPRCHLRCGRLAAAETRSPGSVQPAGNRALVAARRDPPLGDLLAGARRPDLGRSIVGERYEIEGVPVDVVELRGAPGDVVITHIHVFHSGSPNTSDSPRQMLGKGVLAS